MLKEIGLNPLKSGEVPEPTKCHTGKKVRLNPLKSGEVPEPINGGLQAQEKS